jgi:hypothetical protein
MLLLTPKNRNLPLLIHLNKVLLHRLLLINRAILVKVLLNQRIFNASRNRRLEAASASIDMIAIARKRFAQCCVVAELEGDVSDEAILGDGAADVFGELDEVFVCDDGLFFGGEGEEWDYGGYTASKGKLCQGGGVCERGEVGRGVGFDIHRICSAGRLRAWIVAG